MNKKYCVSVDWLEFSCYGNDIPVGNYVIDGRQYQVVDSDKHTRTFKNLRYLLYHGIKYASIRQNPRSSALKQGLTLIKLSNRVLYSTEYVRLSYALMRYFHLQFKGISRIDIAYDCNTFFDGRNPAKFVHDFLFKDPASVGGIYRANGKQFSAYGTRTSCSASKITSIKFGSDNSDVCSYMYDKTIELNEVKDKPWIREMWQKNGLISDEKHHVWRSEISIKASGKNLVNLDTGELFALSPHYLTHYDNIVKLFHFYADKYFDFRQSTGQKNKRHYRKVELFDTSIDITCKPKKVSTKCDTGRSEKVCKNTLQRIVETYTDMSDSCRTSFYEAIKFMEQVSGIKSAISRRKDYENYLSHMKAVKFFDELDIAYMEILEQGRKEREELDAEYIYQCYVMKAAADAGLDV